jgi:predicted NBD/HSP70 family sugar kinase
MDSLRRAAQHLPRVDAIGGSAAGVYVNNEIKFSSLFRGIPRELFDREVKHIFQDLQKAWGGVPFQVVNDGDVTALLGAMSIGDNAVLGLALGTSTAGGYVDGNGHITSRLNETAFVPIDYRDDAPRDEWSGDHGCCVQYLSQQAVGRLLLPAGIAVPEGMSLPRRLKELQALMAANDPRAREVYRTIGVYLGYAVAHLANVYPLRHILLVGRVTSGTGGDILLDRAREVLRAEFPALARSIDFHVPSEKAKRHGQAIAAASLAAAV